ncbi:psbP domain-containing protein 5, chloroplastic [Vigna radiata var. radiata]|uniref:PsbP domain-containing protein 5, chloroplastic n=1 Tax=Vigna radiata var. radiata TaxID=3916 RepID=A0A1S3U252_VIGRR|nr:psbP domain-containing protein 5, chloroplastic [Vigna radiata var. radiata]
MVLPSSSLSLSFFFPTSTLLPNNLIFRNNNRAIFNQHNFPLSKERLRFSCCALKPTSQNRVFRRDLVLLGLTSVSLRWPLSVALAEEEPTMASFLDEINAYSYLYPVESPSNNISLKWVESRKPERYSSAAPLSPDARLRIVSERVDFIDNVIISVTIGPPNASYIKSKDKSTWTAKDVADSVLADRSSLRVTSTQRLEESSVLNTHSSEIDGEKYWYYEYLVRKAPLRLTDESNTYRHYLASTAERDGYLYSISASTISPRWEKLGPFLEKAVSSFRLLSPTENYVPPYKDPWRFW